MSVIINSGRWKTAPDGAVQINWGNPLARGLAFYGLMTRTQSWNLADRKRPMAVPDSSVGISLTTSYDISSRGRILTTGATSDATTYLQMSTSQFDQTALAINGDFTAAILVRANNATLGGTNFNRLWHRGNNGTGAGRWSFNATTAGSPPAHTVYFVYSNSANNATFTTNRVTAASQTVFEMYIVSRVGTSMSIYRNGQTEAAAITSTTNGGAITYPLRWGTDTAAGANCAAASYALSAWWDGRGLSDAEAREFTLAPYQVLLRADSSFARQRLFSLPANVGSFT